MANVRCPMCGKSNPADANVCQNCQARLKPLTPNPAPESTPVQPDVESSQPPEDSSTDWLHGLLKPSSASEEPSEAPLEPPAEPSDNDSQIQADWLSRIRQRSKEEQDALSKIGTPPEINEIPASPPEPPNWLSSVSDKPGLLSSSADDVTAWLDSFRDRDGPIQSSTPEANSTPAAGSATPSANAGQPIAGDPSDEEWLRNLTAGSYPNGLSEPQSEIPAAAGLPTDSQYETDASGADIPEWLRNMEAPPVQIEPPAQVPVSDAETPDWLTDFSSAAPVEPAAVPAEIPDWLKDLKPPTGPLAVTEAAATPAEEAPGWLRDMPDAPLQPEAAPLEVNPTPPASSVDCLSEMSEPPLEETPGEPAASASPEEIPGWLKDYQQAFPTQPAASTPETQEPPSYSGIEAASLEPAASGESPEWLKEYQSSQLDSSPTEPGASNENAWINSFSSNTPVHEEPSAESTDRPRAESFSPFNEEPLPEWMNVEPAEPDGSVQPFTEGEPVPPFASADINEVLAGGTAEDKPGSENTGGTESEPLEPAQLPNWVQAMRPIESAIANAPSPSADDDQRLENSGPLAGLRGVLPGEDLASQYHKPPVYTHKLQVSDKQRLHTNLLETILAGEAKSQPVPGEATQAPQLIVRILVAAVLILVVLLPPLLGIQLPVPANLAAAQPAMIAAFNSIDTLPTGAAVLVAADFEAGRTGEMKAAAEPLLRQLQTHQPKIVLASTIPAGPVLGELLLKEAGSPPAANLGYIAGGSNALKIFGMHASPELPAPLQQAATFPYNKEWSNPVLHTLRDVTSFQRIIVLTDSLESAQAWIEQVQPSLDANTQLIMVSSAQAAPLVRAYVESGQVRGLVSGLTGGAAYEQITRQPGIGASSWTAYQLSLIAVILLIVVGGLIAGISALFQRSQTQRKA